MKTAMIARFVLGASAIFAAAGLVGCGAGEQGSGESGAIGSTSEALVAADVAPSVALTISSVAKYHEFGVQCVLTDANSKKWLVEAGGKNAAGGLSSDVHVFDGTTWYLGGSNALVAQEFATAITDPQHSNVCVMLGGQDIATPPVQTDAIVSLTITVNGMGVPSIAIAQAGKLTDARSKLQAVACDSKILAIAGLDTNGATDVLDVWDPSFMATTTTIPVFKNTSGSTVTLNTPRYDHAAAVAANISSQKDGVLIGGGYDGTSVFSNIEAIRTSNACALDSASATTATDLTAAVTQARLGGTTSAKPRSQLPAFYDGSKFLFFAGWDNTAGASRDQDAITVNWTTYASSTDTYTANAVPTAVASPLFVPYTSNRGFLIGGATTKRETGTPIADAQEYNNGTWTDVTTDKNNAALPTRLGAFGGTLGTSAYFSGGIDSSSNFLNSTYKLY